MGGLRDNAPESLGEKRVCRPSGSGGDPRSLHPRRWNYLSRPQRSPPTVARVRESPPLRPIPPRGARAAARGVSSRGGRAPSQGRGQPRRRRGPPGPKIPGRKLLAFFFFFFFFLKRGKCIRYPAAGSVGVLASAAPECPGRGFPGRTGPGLWPFPGGADGSSARGGLALTWEEVRRDGVKAVNETQAA